MLGNLRFTSKISNHLRIRNKFGTPVVRDKLGKRKILLPRLYNINYHHILRKDFSCIYEVTEVIK